MIPFRCLIKAVFFNCCSKLPPGLRWDSSNQAGVILTTIRLPCCAKHDSPFLPHEKLSLSSHGESRGSLCLPHSASSRFSESHQLLSPADLFVQHIEPEHLMPCSHSVTLLGHGLHSILSDDSSDGVRAQKQLSNSS